MQQIILIGLNHKTAPVALRECIALAPDETIDTQAGLHAHPDISEVIVFSTCNRVEILMAARDRENAIQLAKTFLARTKKISVEQFETALYAHHGNDAVRHLFRVAASLDSMVVGEPQILGQIKAAYLAATRQKCSGPLLNRLLHRAFSVAKRVRTQTGIGDRAVSISFAAVELGRKIFGSLKEKKVMLIGAGEMAELAMEHLVRQQVGEIIVANRTFDRGLAIARRFNGQAIRFDECDAYLKVVDVIIGSTGAEEYVITRDQVKKSLRGRRNRPLFFIDIAVPRDIDPRINHLPNTFVYDIDDLQGVVEENIRDRKEEAAKGERIVEEATLQFADWYESLNVVPTIVALRHKVESIVDGEIQQTLLSRHGILDEDRAAIDRMRNALVKKILHHPTLFLKKNGCQKDRTVYLDAVRKLFDLDGDI